MENFFCSWTKPNHSPYSLSAFWFGACLYQHFAECEHLLCGPTQTHPCPPIGLPHPKHPNKGATAGSDLSHRGRDLWCAQYLAWSPSTRWWAIEWLHEKCEVSRWQQPNSSAPILRRPPRWFKIRLLGPARVVQLLLTAGWDDNTMCGVRHRRIWQLPSADWNRVSDTCPHFF